MKKLFLFILVVILFCVFSCKIEVKDEVTSSKEMLKSYPNIFILKVESINSGLSRISAINLDTNEFIFMDIRFYSNPPSVLHNTGLFTKKEFYNYYLFMED